MHQPKNITEDGGRLYAIIFGYTDLGKEFNNVKTQTTVTFDHPDTAALVPRDQAKFEKQLQLQDIIGCINKINGIFYLHPFELQQHRKSNCDAFPHDHVHGIIELPGRGDNCRPLNRLKGIIGDRQGYFKKEPCFSAKGLLQYMEQPPRLHLVSTRRSWDQRREGAQLDIDGMRRAADKQKDRDAGSSGRTGGNEDEDLNDEVQDLDINYSARMCNALIRDNSNHSVFMHMKAFQERYRCFEHDRFLSYITGEISVPSMLRTNLEKLYSRTNFKTLWDKARRSNIEAIRAESFTSKIHTLSRSTESKKDSFRYLTVDTSLQVFDMILDTWGIDKNAFLGELFAVLEGIKPKKNTFILEGESNSGKSYLIRSLFPIFDNIIGEIHAATQNAFAFQEDCVGKCLLVAEEFMIIPELADQLKLLMEGSECKVAVKHQSDSYINRTPLLCTTNNSITQWLHGNDKVAIQNRVYLHQTKACPGLKEVEKPLNPRMWMELYNWYQSDIMLKALAEDADFLDTLYVSDPLTDAPKKKKAKLVIPNYPNTNSFDVEVAFTAGASANIADDIEGAVRKAAAFNIGTPDEVSDIEPIDDVQPTTSQPKCIKLKPALEFKAIHERKRKRRFETLCDKIADNL
jgi:hypothetical protein